MRYDTGNPLDSDDPKDLSDNAKNLDNYANSEERIWRDRFGRDRTTAMGIELAMPAAIAARDRSEAAADRAELAMQGAVTGADLYTDEPTGRANVADGATFQVLAPGAETIQIYNRISESASELLGELPTRRQSIVAAYSREDQLAESRAQLAELIAKSNQDAITLLLGRVQKLESQSQDVNMTAYALSHTATTTSSTLIASGPVQRIQVLNRSADARVGIAFGAAPTSMNDAGLLVLEPGAALDTDLIPSTPIYAIADSEAQLSGAFAVPLNESNPNWETDFIALVTGMGTDPGGVWKDAYRRLYSALRRERILSRSLGVYVFAAHSDQAARQNWVTPGSYATASGAPVFSAKNGFVYDGVDDYHDSQLNMGGSAEQNPYTGTNNISAMVWPGTEDQATGNVGLGDNVITIEANRSPTQAAMRTATTQADVVAIAGLGTPVGLVRVADDRATAYVAGANSSTIVRGRITGYTQRHMYIGANNTAAGAASFYAGTIRAAQFGKSLTDVQMLAMNAAMQRFFTAIRNA